MQFVSEDMLNKVINYAYINFLNFEQNVIYSLDNEVPNDVDAEASYLGRWIFIELFKKIGNFTPVPNVECGRHLQHVHNDLAERWDFLLCY